MICNLCNGRGQTVDLGFGVWFCTECKYTGGPNSKDPPVLDGFTPHVLSAEEIRNESSSTRKTSRDELTSMRAMKQAMDAVVNSEQERTRMLLLARQYPDSVPCSMLAEQSDGLIIDYRLLTHLFVNYYDSNVAVERGERGGKARAAELRADISRIWAELKSSGEYPEWKFCKIITDRLEVKHDTNYAAIDYHIRKLELRTKKKK